jgi:hypothetical protein
MCDRKSLFFSAGHGGNKPVIPATQEVETKELQV